MVRIVIHPVTVFAVPFAGIAKFYISQHVNVSEQKLNLVNDDDTLKIG